MHAGSLPSSQKEGGGREGGTREGEHAHARRVWKLRMRVPHARAWDPRTRLTRAFYVHAEGIAILFASY